MKRTFYMILVLAFALITNTFGQKPTIELTFTAQYQTQYVMLDSIYVENLTQGGDTILYAPDTVLVLDYVTGVTANSSSNTSFWVSQNRPNPFAEQTSISIFLPEADHLQVSVINLLGQKVAFYENSLDAGSHSFVFYPGDDKYYILTATANGLTKTIKMVSLNNHSSKQVSLNYQGPDEAQTGYKSSQDISDFGYSLGDQLRFIGFAKNPSDIAGSDVIEATPAGNEEYVFEIIEGIPCLETPTVTYEGQIYTTVQIGTQCWFKKNLNVGTMIPGDQEMEDNSIIEKYCYDNDQNNCNTYGALFQWDEMMQYTTQQGTQGICPNGWHLPTDAEWTTLTNFLDGIDVAGGKMKETGILYWLPPNTGATNESGFTALPVGLRYDDGYFGGQSVYAFFWSSTEPDTYSAWGRSLLYNLTSVDSSNFLKGAGFNARCVKDIYQSCPGTPTVTYEGQTYNTVQIGNQCWFKENLNVGTMIDSSNNQTNNSLIEKYCYGDDPANCETYGGLYQWDEMMQYTTQQGVQGICPAGWHLPTDAEWTILTTFLGGESIAGGKMKTTGTIEAGTGLWYAPNAGATNESGFSVLPGGLRYYDGGFYYLGTTTTFWSSTEYVTMHTWVRLLYYSYAYVYRYYDHDALGFSSRCVKDQEQACPGMPTVTDIDGNVYNTVLIGNQCWMKENLKTTTYINGTAIPNVTGAGAWSGLTSGAYVWYENDISWKDKYGALYNWFTTVDANGLCPTGWHVPSNDEWTTLTDYIGGAGEPHGNELKSCRQVNSPLGGGCNTSEHPRWEEDTNYGNFGTDDYGFSGLSGGGRSYSGTFYGIGGFGSWWSSMEGSSDGAWDRWLGYYVGYVSEDYDYKQAGFSVRCLRD